MCQQENQCLEEKTKNLQIIIDENSEAIVSLSVQVSVLFCFVFKKRHKS